MEVGGLLFGSARKALQMIPLRAVASTRAEPLEKLGTAKEPSTESPTAPLREPPAWALVHRHHGGRVREVAEAHRQGGG